MNVITTMSLPRNTAMSFPSSNLGPIRRPKPFVPSTETNLPSTTTTIPQSTLINSSNYNSFNNNSNGTTPTSTTISSNYIPPSASSSDINFMKGNNN